MTPAWRSALGPLPQQPGVAGAGTRRRAKRPPTWQPSSASTRTTTPGRRCRRTSSGACARWHGPPCPAWSLCAHGPGVCIAFVQNVLICCHIWCYNACSRMRQPLPAQCLVLDVCLVSCSAQQHAHFALSPLSTYGRTLPGVCCAPRAGPEAGAARQAAAPAERGCQRAHSPRHDPLPAGAPVRMLGTLRAWLAI